VAANSKFRLGAIPVVTGCHAAGQATGFRRATLAAVLQADNVVSTVPRGHFRSIAV